MNLCCGAASPSQGPWDPDPLRPALSLGGQATAWEGMIVMIAGVGGKIATDGTRFLSQMLRREAKRGFLSMKLYTVPENTLIGQAWVTC